MNVESLNRFFISLADAGVQRLSGFFEQCIAIPSDTPLCRSDQNQRLFTESGSTEHFCPWYGTQLQTEKHRVGAWNDGSRLFYLHHAYSRSSNTVFCTLAFPAAYHPASGLTKGDANPTPQGIQDGDRVWTGPRGNPLQAAVTLPPSLPAWTWRSLMTHVFLPRLPGRDCVRGAGARFGLWRCGWGVGRLQRREARRLGENR